MEKHLGMGVRKLFREGREKIREGEGEGAREPEHKRTQPGIRNLFSEFRYSVLFIKF